MDGLEGDGAAGRTLPALNAPCSLSYLSVRAEGRLRLIDVSHDPPVKYIQAWG